MSISAYMLNKYVDTTEVYFTQGFVEISGVVKPFPLKKVRQDKKVRVIIELPPEEAGTITGRIVKDAVGNIVWDDRKGDRVYSLVKPAGTAMRLEIPIEPSWKGGL